MPAYVVASYSNTLHTAGTFRAWRENRFQTPSPITRASRFPLRKNLGSNGRLRVSARHLDLTLTSDAVPAHTFDRIEKLSPGEIVDVEIDLFPIGLAFHPRRRAQAGDRGAEHTGAIMPAPAITSPRTAEGT